MILQNVPKRRKRWQEKQENFSLNGIDIIYSHVNITKTIDSSKGVELNSGNSSTKSNKPTLIVRNEEIVIVSVVLVIWISVILIFINRWGRIRMLEPYLPDYKSPSLPSISPILPKRASRISINVDPPSSSTTNDKNLVDFNLAEAKLFSSQIYLNRMVGGTANCNNLVPTRQRGNSVIVGNSACMLAIEGFNQARKTRSVENIHKSHSVKTSRSTDI